MRAHAVAAGLALLAGCRDPGGRPPPSSPSPNTSHEVAVPSGTAPLLDGQVGDAEWANAAAIDLGGGVTLRLLHDGTKVYLGVSGLTSSDGFGFACVLLADPDQIALFHASAQLGSALYLPTAAGTFRPSSNDYAWRSADELLRDEGWTGTTVDMTRPSQQELAITFARLGLPSRPRPLALGYFINPPHATDLTSARTLVWPLHLDDAVANPTLLAGFNPTDLHFSPSRWAILHPQP